MLERQAIVDNLARVRERIAVAAERAKRNPAEVLLVAVSKGVEAERIQYAIEAGATDLGENYVQEALEKRPQVPGTAKWHLIGHLQRNKVKQVLGAFDLIQSVDDLALAKEIAKRALAINKEVEILLQVNTSGEATKFGAPPEKLEELAEQVAGLSNIRLSGLMTIGQLEPGPQGPQEEFRRLAQLFQKIKDMRLPNAEMRWLSMGMTHDYEVAIEAGANLVRVGRGIFGARR
jgi:PLP dependent protein